MQFTPAQARVMRAILKRFIAADDDLIERACATARCPTEEYHALEAKLDRVIQEDDADAG